jgi:hypothetical protein
MVGLIMDWTEKSIMCNGQVRNVIRNMNVWDRTFDETKTRKHNLDMSCENFTRSN